jgi:Uma2 family endonuclease
MGLPAWPVLARNTGNPFPARIAIAAVRIQTVVRRDIAKQYAMNSGPYYSNTEFRIVAENTENLSRNSRKFQDKRDLSSIVSVEGNGFDRAFPLAWRASAIMRSMSFRTSHDDVLEAAEHLPAGATLVIHEFDWYGYERLLNALGERRLRVSYDCGRLEILSPSTPHEEYARLLDLAVFVFCEVFGLKLRSFGGATWKRRALAAGLEADACYYTKSAELIRGKNVIDIESDPPPDIAVEIDVTSDSVRKSRIYAALSIPEIWRYDGKTFHLYALTDGKYLEIHDSRFLPGLTDRMLAEVMEASKAGETIEGLQAFRRRIQSLKR